MSPPGSCTVLHYSGYLVLLRSTKLLTMDFEVQLLYEFCSDQSATAANRQVLKSTFQRYKKCYIFVRQIRCNRSRKMTTADNYDFDDKISTANVDVSAPELFGRSLFYHKRIEYKRCNQPNHYHHHRFATAKPWSKTHILIQIARAPIFFSKIRSLVKFKMYQSRKKLQIVSS